MTSRLDPDDIDEIAYEIDSNNEWKDGMRISHKNRWFELDGGDIIVSLTKGKYMLISECDLDILCNYTWYYNVNGYACSSRNGKTILCHRVVLGKMESTTDTAVLSDHINRARLDNRRYNLRWVTSSQSNLNTSIPRNNTTGVKGVCWSEAQQQYIVDFPGRKRRTFKPTKSGRFRTKDEAFRAARALRLQYEVESDELC